jgi:hypothetical protein
MTPESMISLTREIDALIAKRRAIGENLPPVKLDDVKNDPVFERSVLDWMIQRMPTIDTTLLDRDDADKWERLTPPRFDAREVDGGWRVYDSNTDDFASETCDEYDARDLADQYESECMYGFPFAWNTGWMLDHDDWLDELHEVGFLVYRYDGDAVIAGIDGGGYAFMDAHFKPLYAALAEKYEWLVETSHGPRRITTK